jgi:hypothetical protein
MKEAIKINWEIKIRAIQRLRLIKRISWVQFEVKSSIGCKLRSLSKAHPDFGAGENQKRRKYVNALGALALFLISPVSH